MNPTASLKSGMRIIRCSKAARPACPSPKRSSVSSIALNRNPRPLAKVNLFETGSKSKTVTASTRSCAITWFNPTFSVVGRSKLERMAMSISRKESTRSRCSCAFSCAIFLSVTSIDRMNNPSGTG